MGQFGEDLRKERQDRGIAIKAITDVTKISGRHLLALEEEHFDALPGGVFNKGIMRGYARVVGLDEDAWVGRFMSAYQQSGQLKDDDVSWIEFAENVSKTRPDDGPRPDVRLRWAGVGVLLVLLSALGWFVWHYVSNRAATANVVTQQSISELETTCNGAFHCTSGPAIAVGSFSTWSVQISRVYTHNVRRLWFSPHCGPSTNYHS